ncbi:ankyrin repeat, SAM and basic leucine zipper domain-containing protein 1-like isoform X2 [Patiria miniata]|uniref:Ankyrin repeat, SAM and basic leucine zipper domain-containing protein 1 n=1 Tax=Patiria miniata TaxID=46514 RepID=A0A914BA14_PATMI|nr:ankyrin repeat, SAM and basic leucine zipper domain-containing protein 1-like isoform X1 [Patiria miniata]XP_038073174.1 ankyrin repeat, SAM and basic leucine zipper domain-containing protein 1-like isoform X2 [Patiria miniata]
MAENLNLPPSCAGLPAGTEDHSDDEDGLCIIIDGDAASSLIVDEQPPSGNLHLEWDSVKSVKPSSETPFHDYQNGSDSGWTYSQPSPNILGASKRDKQGFPIVLDDFRIAVCRGNLQEVEAFHLRGVAVDTTLRAGWTALMYAAFYGRIQILEFLLERGADVNFNKASYMYTPLIAAASSVQEEHYVTSCLTILLERDASPNVHERSHMTPLMFVSKNGNLSAVQKLLEFGAQTDRQDNRGWTALCYAANQGFTSIAECLLNAEADIHKRCSEGTARDIACNRGYIELTELIDKSVSISAGEKDPVRHALEGLQFSQPSRPIQMQPENSLSTNQISSAYGEGCDDLDLFLCGLDLGHLSHCFHQQAIKFSVLLQMSEEDLEKIGINKYGWRQKIMDAVQEIHKRKWEPGSVQATGKRILSHSESMALIKNITKHVAYIGSSITYVGNNWKAHKTLFDEQDDPVNLQRLMTETDEGLNKTIRLFEEFRKLKGQLNQATNSETVLPADLILDSEDMPRIGRRLTAIFAVTLLTTSLFVLFRRNSIQTIVRTGI